MQGSSASQHSTLYQLVSERGKSMVMLIIKMEIKEKVWGRAFDIIWSSGLLQDTQHCARNHRNHRKSTTIEQQP